MNSSGPLPMKYVKMLQVGLKEDVVKHKMILNGDDPILLSKHLTASDPINLKKYYKMIKIGIPKGAVQNKMKQDGLDPQLLNEVENEVNTNVKTTTKTNNQVDYSQDPKYSKYFKMTIQ